MTEARRKRIRQTLKATRERRTFQIPCVYQLKLTKFNKTDIQLLDQLFFRGEMVLQFCDSRYTKQTELNGS